MEYDADIGIWIPGSHIYRRSAPMASDIQPAADCFYGFAIYGDFRSLRDGTCHHNAGGTVYHIWQGDITISDPDRRTGRKDVYKRQVWNSIL